MFVRIAVAVAIGCLVLLGWTSASAAEAGHTAEQPAPVAQGGRSKPLLGIDLKPITGLLTPLTESVGTTLETATAPVISTLAPTVQATTQTVRPVVKTVQDATKPLTPVVAPVLRTVEHVVSPVVTPVVEQVVNPVVAPVVDHVIVPVVRDVVAPIVSPALAPVITPVVGSLGGGTLTPVTDVIDGPLGPIIDPLIDPTTDTVTDVLEPAGGTTTAGVFDAGSVDRAADPADKAPPQSPTLELTGNDASLTASVETVTGSAATSAAILSMPAAPAFTSHHTTDHRSPATSSDLPDVPMPVLPAGSLCTGSSGGGGSAPMVGTAPGVESNARSWKRVRLSTANTTIPDGRPRPQPGFAPD